MYMLYIYSICYIYILYICMYMLYIYGICYIYILYIYMYVYAIYIYISRFPAMRLPQNGWFLMEIPIKMDDLYIF